MFFLGKKNTQARLCAELAGLAEDGIIIIDDDHFITYFNGAAERIFGYAAVEVIGQHLDLLIPDRFHTQHNLEVDQFGAGADIAKYSGHRRRQIYGRRKDGSEFINSTSVFRLGSKNSRYYAAVVRDVSESKRTEEELLRLAATDPLTGAFNRREFTALADRESLRSNRYHHPLSIMMLDIDHFKKLNDTYGHAAGDKALQRFTTLCCNALRNVDIFGRWGGEEFVALLPETNIDGAVVISERLRKLASETVINYNEHKISFTVSIGVAQYRDGEISIDGPLGRADSAVYEAKKAGRNRVSIYRN